MKTIVAILFLATTGLALAESGKTADQPVTAYKDGKPYIDDRLFMRRRLPSGFRSDAPQAPPEVTEDKAGKPYIYDSLRRMAPRCAPQDAPCPAPDKPEMEKKPAPKGAG